MNSDRTLVMLRHVNWIRSAGERPIYVFGAGETGQRLIEDLRTVHVKIAGIVDNDESKWGQTILGLRVYGPEILNQGIFVIIGSSYGGEIAQQLNSLGLIRNTDYADMQRTKMKLKKAILRRIPLSIRVYLHILTRRNIGRTRRFRRKNVGEDCYIDPSVQIIGYKNVTIGDNSTLSEDTWLNVNHRVNEEKKIIIGSNCHIGRRNFFSSGPLIHIKDYCFTGIDCRFLGCGHVIDSPFIPYIASGLTPGDVIEIGPNCWLTTAVTVMQGVKIGCGSVIGAGSIVLKDIPPFSIAAGNPCRVLKRFDFKTNQWVNIDDWSEELVSYFPTEDGYLSILQRKYSKLSPALISSSSRFGWL